MQWMTFSFSFYQLQCLIQLGDMEQAELQALLALDLTYQSIPGCLHLTLATVYSQKNILQEVSHFCSALINLHLSLVCMCNDAA